MFSSSMSGALNIHLSRSESNQRVIIEQSENTQRAIREQSKSNQSNKIRVIQSEPKILRLVDV